MFPLAAKDFPRSADELAESIRAALLQVFSVPSAKKKQAEMVRVSGGKFPALKTLRINLDGAAVSATERPSAPKGIRKRQAGPRIEKLEISGQPLRYAQTKLNLKVVGSGLRFDFARDKQDHPLLVLRDADSGTVEARITKKDIETLLHALASTAAERQGITVQDLALELRADGPRSIAADVRVRAEKLLMSSVIHVRGRLDVDDQLNATLTDLACEGEGIVGAAAARVLAKKIERYDGRTLPLMAFSLGDVALSELEIVVKDSVRISAAFGREA